MIKNIWSVPCENIIQDQISNKESYFFAIESGTFNEFPTTIPKFCLATFWKKYVSETISFKVRVTLKDPYDNILDVIYETPAFDFEQSRQHINLLNLGGAQIPEPGEYKLLIEYSAKGEEWEHGADLPILFSYKEDSK